MMMFTLLRMVLFYAFYVFIALNLLHRCISLFTFDAFTPKYKQTFRSEFAFKNLLWILELEPETTIDLSEEVDAKNENKSLRSNKNERMLKRTAS